MAGIPPDNPVHPKNVALAEVSKVFVVNSDAGICPVNFVQPKNKLPALVNFILSGLKIS